MEIQVAQNHHRKSEKKLLTQLVGLKYGNTFDSL